MAAWKWGVAIAVAAAAAAGGVYLALAKTTSKLVLTLSPSSVVQGSVLEWSLTGATPDGAIQTSVITSGGQQITLTPNLTADSQGDVGASFTVGTNIPVGANSLESEDLTSGRTATAAFDVTA
jgi:hypothetical protein